MKGKNKQHIELNNSIYERDELFKKDGKWAHKITFKQDIRQYISPWMTTSNFEISLLSEKLFLTLLIFVDVKFIFLFAFHISQLICLGMSFSFEIFLMLFVKMMILQCYPFFWFFLIFIFGKKNSQYLEKQISLTLQHIWG